MKIKYNPADDIQLQLKALLRDKIKLVNEYNEEVTSEKSEELLLEYMTGGCYTTEEISEKYNVNNKELRYLIKSKMIPSFTISIGDSSKTFLLKSEFEKQKELVLNYAKQKAGSKLASFGLKILYRMKEANFLYYTDSIKLYNDYYFTDKSDAEIALQYNTTPEKVIKEVEQTNRYILKEFYLFLRQKQLIAEVLKDHTRLKKQFNKQQELIRSNAELSKLIDFPVYTGELLQLYSTDLKELDFSVRTLNCFRALKINTISDLLNYPKEDLLKMRNFGKKSLYEIPHVLNRLGIEY